MLVSEQNINKPFWEELSFFVIFILSFIEGLFYSFYSTIMKAWRHQVGLFAGLCFFMPVVKMILFPEILISFFDENLVYAVMSIVFILIGIFFAFVYRHLNKNNHLKGN